MATAKITPLSPGAIASLTRPLIRADGSFDRRAICIKARSLVMRGDSLSSAMQTAWLLARRQLAQAKEYDADVMRFRTASRFRKAA